MKQSSASRRRQSLKPHVPLSRMPELPGQGLPRAPQGSFKSQRCDNLIGDSGGQTLLVTRDPMTCEVIFPI